MPIIADHRPYVRCVDCKYLAGSERKCPHFIVDDSYFCDHPDCPGGKWSLHPLHHPNRKCDNFDRASDEKIAQRERAFAIIRRMYGSKTRH